MRKVTNRPRVGTLTAKWLAELEEEENIIILPRFKERYFFYFFIFIFFYIRCIILRTILRMQPLSYGVIVLYT